MHLFQCNGAKGNFTEILQKVSSVHFPSIRASFLPLNTFSSQCAGGKYVNPEVNTVTLIAPGRITVPSHDTLHHYMERKLHWNEAAVEHLSGESSTAENTNCTPVSHVITKTQHSFSLVDKPSDCDLWKQSALPCINLITQLKGHISLFYLLYNKSSALY